MQRKFKPLHVLTAAAAILSQSAFAVDGTISFTGSISAQTCTIAGNGASGGDFVVALPRVSTASLNTPGSTAGRTFFTISLSGCTPAAGDVHTFFEAGPTTDTATGNLILASGTGTATNVQIGLLNADTSPIRAGFPDASQNSRNVALSGGAATLRYIAEYVATGAATAGTANSSVRYTVVYP
ncbi:major type 1 subunit fimbrin (pilin) [Cupriavidus sp. YR651]|uniref:fimbrial protein n=1 Tax=Cupriavidus sp. YR651 TaxID=1855315 RepID=UPI00088CCC8C|nr:fimbrial protein [Cupriavidus sp. YR651]SDD37985.1 major type 1 subunit fimbrin (pilin) [Cupriavidus sp. YR651]